MSTIKLNSGEFSMEQSSFSKLIKDIVAWLVKFNFLETYTAGNPATGNTKQVQLNR
jgi:hypothetical protein